MASAAARLRLKYMVGVKGRLIHRAATTMKTLTRKVRAQKKIMTGVHVWYKSMTAWVVPLLAAVVDSSEMNVGQVSLTNPTPSTESAQSCRTRLALDHRHGGLCSSNGRWLDDVGDGDELNHMSITVLAILVQLNWWLETNKRSVLFIIYNTHKEV